MNTVALPDPTVVMSPAFVQGLRLLARTDFEQIESLIDDVEEELSESTDEWDEKVETEFVGLAPSEVLLDGEPGSLDVLREIIYGVDVRWRLDATMAVLDLATEEN